jgi:hypothetical protein
MGFPGLHTIDKNLYEPKRSSGRMVEENAEWDQHDKLDSLEAILPVFVGQHQSIPNDSTVSMVSSRTILLGSAEIINPSLSPVSSLSSFSHFTQNIKFIYL